MLLGISGDAVMKEAELTSEQEPGSVLVTTESELRIERLVGLAGRALGASVSIVRLDSGSTLLGDGDGSLHMVLEALLGRIDLRKEGNLLISDLPKDERFADLPGVAGPPHLRFLVASPVQGSDGSRVGSLCLMGCEPRTFSKADFQALADATAAIEDAFDQGYLGTAPSDPHQIANRVHVLADRPLGRPAHFDTETDSVRIAERYRTLVDQASDGIVVVEMGGPIVDANRKASELSGYTKEELLRLSPEDLFDQTSLSERPLQWAEIKEGKTFLSERTVRRKDGSLLSTELSVTRLACGQIQVIARDLTARKEAEHRLRDSRRFLRSILDSLAAHIAVLDSEGTIVATNKAWREFAVANGLGTHKASEGQNYLDACDAAAGVDAAEATPVAQGIRSVIRGDSDSFSLEYPCHAPDEKRWFVVRVSRFDSDEPCRVVVAHENITARKLAEVAESNLRIKYQTLAEQAIAGVYIIQNYRLTYVNPQFSTICGYSSDEALAMPDFREMVIEIDRHKVEDQIERRLSGEVKEVHYGFRIRRKDGSVAHVEAHGGLIDYDGEPAIMGVLLDVTDRVQMENERQRLHIEIQHERTRLKDVFMHAPVSICMLAGPDHVFEMANPRYYELVGQRDILGKPVAEALPEVVDQGLVRILDGVYQTGVPRIATELEVQLRRTASGESDTRIVNFVYHPLAGTDGRSTGILVHGVDVTDQVRARQEAERVLRANQLIMTRSLDVICTVDDEYRFVSVSTASETMWGYRPDELVGRHYADFVVPEDLEKTADVAEMIVSGHPVKSFENRFVRADGSTRSQAWSAVWSEVDGLMFCVARDIDELRGAERARESAEHALRSSQRRFARLVEKSAEVITLLAPDGTVAYQSPSIQGVLGYDPEHFATRNAFDLVHPDDLPGVLTDIRALYAGEPHTSCEIRFLSSEGEWRWLDISATNMLEDDAVKAIVLNSRDVTERKTNQALLVEREELLTTAARVATALNAEPDASVGIEASLEILGHAVSADRVYVFENHLSASGQKLTSQRFEWCREDIEPQIDNPYLQNRHIEDLLGGWADALFAGEPLAVAASVVPDEVRDQLQAQSIRSLLAVPIIVEGQQLGIIGLDDCRRERSWTEAQCSVITTIATIIGGFMQQRQFDAERTAHLAAVAASVERFRTLADSMPQLVWTASPTGEVDYFNRRIDQFADVTSLDDRRWKWAMPLHPDDVAATNRAWKRSLETGHTYDVEHRVVLKDETLRWFLSRATPQRDVNGEVVKWYGTTTDIHDQKVAQDELRRAKDEAEKMNRLKSSFLTNMSHEIRTPLTSIIGFSEMLSESLPGDMSAMARMIQSGGERLMETLNSVLDLAQIESGAMNLTLLDVEVGEFIRDTVGIYVNRANQNGLSLTLKVPSHPVYAAIDRGAFGRIISNLVSNAIKFTARGGVEVSLDSFEDAVLLTVNDTGEGISEEFLSHIFDEFKQESTGLSRNHEGSGLGLTITKRLVELMGGSISVKSEKHKGSSFQVRLPRRVSGQNGRIRSLPEAVEDTSHRGRILVVEDSSDTRHLLRHLLDVRFDVTDATGVEDALEAARGSQFDALLIDINLSEERTGIDLLEVLRKTAGYEAVPALACTAYALPGDKERFLEIGFNGYVAKPYRKAELLAAIDALIGSKKVADPGSPSTE
jgi:PAS domain S-box-containing protein